MTTGLPSSGRTDGTYDDGLLGAAAVEGGPAAGEAGLDRALDERSCFWRFWDCMCFCTSLKCNNNQPSHTCPGIEHRVLNKFQKRSKSKYHFMF